jgi:hypothetical protein
MLGQARCTGRTRQLCTDLEQPFKRRTRMKPWCIVLIYATIMVHLLLYAQNSTSEMDYESVQKKEKEVTRYRMFQSLASDNHHFVARGERPGSQGCRARRDHFEVNNQLSRHNNWA